MRQVILYIGMSLDGYIADREGKVEFLRGHCEEAGDGGYEKWIQGIDTIIMGMRTYRQITTELSPGKWPYPGKKCYVFSREKHAENPDVTFFQGGLQERVRKWKGEDGKSIWICGGARIVAQLIREDLIDVYDISIVPTLLGGGIPLFPRAERERLLRLDGYSAENGIARLIYRRR